MNVKEYVKLSGILDPSALELTAMILSDYSIPHVSYKEILNLSIPDFTKLLNNFIEVENNER